MKNSIDKKNCNLLNLLIKILHFEIFYVHFIFYILKFEN